MEYFCADQLITVVVIHLVTAATCATGVCENTIAASLYVNLDATLHVTDDRFLSLGMDSNLIRDRWETFDFNSTRLQTLARGLAPAYMRLMGTDGDRMVFVRDDKRETLKLSSNFGGWPFPKNSFNMTSSDWDAINKWTAAVGWRLLFGINAQMREPLSYGNGSYWDASNALELLDYSVEKGYASNLDFEFGNEPNIWFSSKGFTPVPPEQLGKEFEVFGGILKHLYGEHFSKSLLVGPDTAGSGDNYMTRFLNSCGHSLNAITFHHYYGKGSDIVNPKNFTDPSILDEYRYKVNDVMQAVTRSTLRNVTVWQGETSSTVSPPGNGIAETYVAGFMLLDKLGLSASLGLSLVVRQTFYGFWFALVDKHLEPRPNYWLAAMFKQLVGKEVLSTQVDVRNHSNKPASLRAYAHCVSSRSGYVQGSVVVYAMNLFNNTVKIHFNNTLSSENVHTFLWTAPKGNLTSVSVMLNGQIVKMINDKKLPHFKPVILKAASGMTLPNYSIAFFVFPEVKVKQCTSGHKARYS